MRPSSSSDPNATHRATTPVFIDFFAKEAAEEQERTTTIAHQGPFAELSPRDTSPSYRPNSTADAGPSATPHVTIITIQRYLIEKGYKTQNFLKYETIQRRLNGANLSAETLLAALQTVHNPQHSLLARLSMRHHEQTELRYMLAGITFSCAGFRPAIKEVVQNANNNPDQLITNLLQYVRSR